MVLEMKFLINEEYYKMEDLIITEKQEILYRLRRELQLLAGKILPEKLMTKIYYRIVLKKNLDFNNLNSLNEKIQWYKLNYCPNNDLVVKCSDKYAVREYVKNMGFSEILNPLLNVWEDPQNINWNELPKKFALKGNHG